MNDYGLYSNPYIVNYNYNPHNTDIIESIDVLLEIFDRFADDEDEDENERWNREEESQRMSIEPINLTQQIINEEILEQPELIRQPNNEIINSYLQNGDEFIEICSICLDDVVDMENISKLSCRHHFHTNCIKLCLKRSRKCPLCRQFCLRNYQNIN